MADFSHLKQGDVVIVEYGGANRSLALRRVEKRTKLHIVVDGRKYRTNGFAVKGSTWSRSMICEATTEAVAEVRHAARLSRYRDMFYGLARSTDDTRVLRAGAAVEALEKKEPADG